MIWPFPMYMPVWVFVPFLSLNTQHTAPAGMPRISPRISQAAASAYWVVAPTVLIVMPTCFSSQ